jgi:hypothetical protein
VARFADLAEFGPTLDAAAERLSISPTALEKDYWVSQVVRVLSRDFAGDFVFKGGTSLSKGYRLLERFSEDRAAPTPQVVRGATRGLGRRYGLPSGGRRGSTQPEGDASRSQCVHPHRTLPPSHFARNRKL